MIGWEAVCFIPGHGLLLKRKIAKDSQKESLLDDKTTIIGGRPFEEILEEKEGLNNNNPTFRCPPNMDENI